MSETLFSLRGLRPPFQDLSTSLAELKNRPGEAQSDRAVIRRHERSSVLVYVLRERTDLGNVFGPGRIHTRTRLFHLTAGRLDLRVLRESGVYSHARRRRGD